ncbi:hypothetical protein CGCTS75_v011746 [Colletotrichum tropicale]|nr:hypothetical protein CGCTS75_v011746 [Colletotrichum tropicale]
MGERTGSRVLQWVWSYVHTDDGLLKLSGLIPGYQLRQVNHSCNEPSTSLPEDSSRQRKMFVFCH